MYMTKDMMCCGGVPVSIYGNTTDTRHECCDGKLIPKANDDQQCCDGKLISLETHKCCGGNPVPLTEDQSM